MKQVLKAGMSAILAAALLFPAAAQVHGGTTFTDIEGSYAQDAILELAEKGILQGDGQGSFDPTGDIKRQDFAIILAKALKLDIASPPPSATFSDVPTDHYAHSAIEAAVKSGLINGHGNGEFGGADNLTREQMAAIFVRALGVDAAGKGADLKFSDASQISDWAKDAVGIAVELQILNGLGNNMFDPQGTADRQAVAKAASNFLNAAESNTALSFSSAPIDIHTLQLNFSREMAAFSADQLRITIKATGESVGVSGVTLAEDKKSSTVSHSELKPATTYTISYLAMTTEFTTPPAEMEISPSSSSITLGGQVSFTAKLMFKTGSSEIELQEPIAWSASSGSIDQTGNFTGNTAGTATITAAFGDYKASATVTVQQPVYVPPVDREAPELTVSVRITPKDQPVYATSSETGMIYVVPLGRYLSDPPPTVAQLNELSYPSETSVRQAVSAGIPTLMPMNSLSVGSYYLYAVDASGNVSVGETVDLDEDVAPSIMVEEFDDGAYSVSDDLTLEYGEQFRVTSSEAGFIYIFNSQLYPNMPMPSQPTEIISFLEGLVQEAPARAIKHTAVYNIGIEFSANGDNEGIEYEFEAGHSYMIVAIDQTQHVSGTVHVRIEPLP